jgi:hypothetical protein
MSLLTPIVYRHLIGQKPDMAECTEIYVCPNDKTHAIVDLSFYKEDTTQDSLIAVALSSKINKSQLNTVDFFIDDIELIQSVNIAELHKVIVGTNERLYIWVISGPNISVRLSGVEENNSKIKQAGVLATDSFSETTQKKLFTNSLQNTAYTSSTLTIYNHNPSTPVIAEVWISPDSTNPPDRDKVLKVEIPANDTTIIENMLLGVDENVFVRSSLANTEYFMNGIIVSS